MKLLLDENLSRRLVSSLAAYYPDTTQIALLGFNGKNDSDIWQYAQGNGYAIVTQDADFHEQSLLCGGPPLVLWLRCGNQPKQVILSKLIKYQPRIEAANADPSIWCIEIY